MSDKIARLGIVRDNDMMYYIKKGDVWATPRKQKGQPKGKAQKIESTGLALDYSKYIYYLDGDGDVARKARALGGGGRKAKAKSVTAKSVTSKAKAKSVTTDGNGAKTTKAKASRSSISGHYVTEATAKRHPRTTVEETVTRGKKSEEQLDREIEEFCRAQDKKHGGNGNGTTSAGKPAAKKKRR